MLDAQVPASSGFVQDCDDLLHQQYVRTNTGFGDFDRVTTLVNKYASGQESRCDLGISTLDSVDGYHKTLITVLTPGVYKGLAILSHPGPSALQWIYMPATGQVAAVNLEDRTAAFFESEFTYEDAGLSSYKDYINTYVGSRDLNGKSCHVVNSVPRDSKSGYSKIVYWIEQSTLFNQKIDYYDKAGDLLKTLNMDGWSLYTETFAVVKDMYMVNHQTGAQSELHISQIKLGNHYASEDFMPERIRRTQ